MKNSVICGMLVFFGFAVQGQCGPFLEWLVKRSPRYTTRKPMNSLDCARSLTCSTRRGTPDGSWQPLRGLAGAETASSATTKSRLPALFPPQVPQILASGA